jgi:hypothetical protein
MVFALVAGAAIAWVDSRPTWDDTGVSAALVFFAAALASVLRVRPVLAIVFVAGPLIAVSLVHGDNGGLLAGFIAALGALIGAKLRAGRDRT